MRRFVLFVMPILFTLACMTVDTLTPVPVSTPTELSVIIPYPMQTSRPAPTGTSTPASFVSTPVLFPFWVADFSDPILKSLQSQQPAFEDDFPSICINPGKAWKVCATPQRRLNYQYPLSSLVTSIPRPTLDLQPDLQKGYSVVNKGWFFIVPGSDKNPFYAHIDNGALVLKLPEGKINKDLMITNPHLARKNFVLLLDFEFKESKPDDIVRFQFNQSADQSFALDLSKNKTWTFHWGSHDNWQSRTGVYEYFPPDPITVVIVAQGTRCAVYVNNDPLDYFSGCRTGAVVQASPQAVSFHLLTEPDATSIVTVDNVVLWDLDEIPGLR